MPVSCSENASFAILVRPENGVFLFVHFAFGGREYGGVGPNLFDDIKFVHGGGVAFRDRLHDRVILFDDGHWVSALMVVFAACDTQEFSPIIDLGGAVGVHCAVDDDGVHPFIVRFGNAADVGFVVCVREAFVVNDDIMALEPLRIFVEVNHGLGPFAPLIDDDPVDWDTFFLGCQLHGFALEFVIMAAAARYQQHRQVLLGRRGIAVCNGLLR